MYFNEGITVEEFYGDDPYELLKQIQDELQGSPN